MKHRLIWVVIILALYPASVWCQKITKESFDSEGKKRTYYLYVPATLKPDGSVPLLILLHGSNRVGLSLAEKWKDLANKEGFLMVAPDSLNSAVWGTPVDGPVFLRDLVEELKAKHPIDPQRVYLFGHSGGAGLPC
ncbi:MAG TPA: hypothetical protein VJU86_17505 [Pyrinomonadaceae bacterium]|nr:hypothetical protein [Pyrinomonadaceae bacterium]